MSRWWVADLAASMSTQPPGGSTKRCGRAQVRPGGLGAEPPGMVPGGDQEPVPGVLPVPALPPAIHPDRDHPRQLQPASDHRHRPPGRGMGRGEQRRHRLHADELVLVKPHPVQFTALRYFALDGTDHASHKEQASMIRRYIIWRNNHAYDE